MPDGTGGGRASYKLKSSYTISERIALLVAYRVMVSKIAKANGRKISVQALSDIIDDVFISFDGWPEVTPLFKTIYKARLDPHTLQKLLQCDLSLNVRKLHIRSLHVLDGFLQIATKEPPSWLSEIVRE